MPSFRDPPVVQNTINPRHSRPYQGPLARAVLSDLSLPFGHKDSLGRLDRDRVVLLNPTQFNMRGGAEYPTMDISGLSHQVQQWSHTRSLEYSFTLQWAFAVESARAKAAGRGTVDTDFYTWIQRFIFPVDRGQAPPLFQLFWPNFLIIVGNVTDIDTTVTQWGRDGMPMEYNVQLTVREYRREFLRSVDFVDIGLVIPDAP